MSPNLVSYSLIIFATIHLRASIKIKRFLSILFMNEIRAILFDLDNTLIDFLRMKEESCRAAAHAMVLSGLQMDEAKAYERLIKTYFSVGIESDNAFSEFLKSAGQFDHKILAAAINAYLDAKSKCLKPYPNVKAVLRKLQKNGIFLSIVTDAPKTKAYQRLLAMGIEPYFQFVVGYEDTNSAKHTGLPLLLALDLLKKEIPDIKAEEVLMVGDSMARDIIPAERIGFQTALSRYGETGAELANSDFELANFKDILAVL
jgi:FMN phosphatase YigB (HAD superfamily)